MKRNPILWLTSAVMFSTLVAYVLAQQVAPRTPGKLESAVALLNEGKAQEAKEIIGSIETNSPDYAPSRRYYALSLYELKDYAKFLGQMESPAVKEAAIDPKMREDLAFGEIDALFFLRKFEDIFQKIQVFQSEHPGSVRSKPVTEYRLAALYERGMKKAHEASMHGDTNKFNARWAEAKTNLEEFLALASTFRVTNYSSLPKRAVREDIWAARMVLGDETEALQEVPIRDVASREKFSLLRVKLYKKLRPHAADENLQRMSEFLQQFPTSKYRKRVEFDMADVAYHEGERLCIEAEAIESAGDPTSAEAKRALAVPYFEFALPLLDRVVEDKVGGVELADVLESREARLRIFYAQKDYTNLLSWAAYLTANSQPGENEWLRAKLFEGAVLVNQMKFSEGAAALDKMMAFGFKNSPSHDRFIAKAAKWRIYVAIKSGDVKTAQQLIEWVKQAGCTKSIQADVVDAFPSLTGPQNRNSK